VDASQPLVVLVPGTIWETKHWTIEGFAGVARHFSWMDLPSHCGHKTRPAALRKSHAAAPGACDLSGKTRPQIWRAIDVLRLP